MDSAHCFSYAKNEWHMGTQPLIMKKTENGHYYALVLKDCARELGHRRGWDTISSSFNKPKCNAVKRHKALFLHQNINLTFLLSLPFILSQSTLNAPSSRVLSVDYERRVLLKCKSRLRERCYNKKLNYRTNNCIGILDNISLYMLAYLLRFNCLSNSIVVSDVNLQVII